ncbi:four-carbon acid sugar kinase family protein [Paenibacillus cymbidii]|uniref:four-carbon acid sugar kinase family protein n=1 Tax=Paenibacillus cymbidii TaxID=1639034 RepID=UPI001F44F3CD|nr:four-carbon acid sugar kinase family protein [Paenibacillus cymbidii]
MYGMVGVVADDITGAGDIGIMFAKAGLTADVYSYGGTGTFRPDSACDALVLDTDSRFDEPLAAYGKVFEATRRLQELGCTQYINKTCSVFRGNIGPAFDAMLDALGESFAVVVLGFPKNGRTTVGGIHYVHGRKLEESEFRHDPVHPMTDSDLAAILRRQTSRTVASVPFAVVDAGAETLRAELDGHRSADVHYAIVDVTDQAALAVIAEAVHDVKVLCGSSALSEELALLRQRRTGAATLAQRELPIRRTAGLGVLCAAGSLMPQTAAQIAYMKERGIASYRIDTLRLLDEREREAETLRLVEAIAADIARGVDVLYHSESGSEQVAAVKAEAARRGIDNKAVSRLVSGTVAAIAAETLARTGQNRLLVAGGDTSAAVCARLGVTGMRVWKEIQPGLPSCLTLPVDAERSLLLVLKSGSFGKPDFFEQAIAHLKQQ